jgi:CBS domain containing-hemolysin-like protein
LLLKKGGKLRYYTYMITFIAGIFCSVVAVVQLVLYRTYQHVPARELKRMARQGDEVAALLYRPVAYGLSLQLLLGLLAVVFGALSLGFLVEALGVWWAILLALFVVGLGGLLLVPSGDLSRSSLWLAARAAPGVSWLLERLHPVFNTLSRFARRLHPLHVHTGLYEKSDLVELLEAQKGQADSRVSADEIELLTHALTFGDRLVADALVPRRVVRMVSAEEAVGPILMGELHKSGHSRFPVYEGKHDNIVGVLHLHDLVSAKQTATVASLMNRRLTYVHEDFSLYQTLQAFLKTKQHLFLVVNSFEEFVGIITIEDVLEQMIGKPIVDEFDRYDDLRAVAAAAAHQDHKARQKSDSEPTPEPKPDAAP